jgi:hypothetical protein
MDLIDTDKLEQLIRLVANETAAATEARLLPHLMPHRDDDEIYSEEVAAKRFGVSKHTLGDWRRKGVVDPPIRPKRPVGWSEADIQAGLIKVSGRKEREQHAKRNTQ